MRSRDRHQHWELTTEAMPAALLGELSEATAISCRPVLEAEDGLAGWRYRIPPCTAIAGRAPSPGGGQFWLVLADGIREEDAVELVLEPGDVSLHHTLTVHSSGTNRSDGWWIGISYIPPRVHHIGPTRLSATLARGTDRFNHFDHEAPPQAELDKAALAAHADSQSRYWKAASGIAEMRHIH
jgi:Phytanoyl-CoA dioxygenase (PhyH)